MTTAYSPPRGWPASAGAIAFITATSLIILCVLPILLGLFTSQFALDWRQLGWLGSTMQGGTLAGTLIAWRMVARRASRPGMLWGAGCAALFCFLTGFASDFPQLLSCQFIAGAGAGCAFGIGNCLLARTAEPERSFALMFGIQNVFSFIYLAALPLVKLHLGYTGAMGSLAMLFVAIFLVARRAHYAEIPAERHVDAAAKSNYRSRYALLGILLFEIGILSIWVYSDRIGTRWGLAPDQIGAAVAIGGIGGIPAAVLGAVTGNRFGSIPMLIFASAAVLAGEFLVLHQATIATYAAGQFVLNFGWFLGLSYYMGIIANHDPAGVTMRSVPTVIIAASAVAPACVALTSQYDAELSMLVLSAALCGAALLLAMLASRRLTPTAEHFPGGVP